MNQIPNSIKENLWEYDTNKLTIASPIVIQRVLEYGSPKDFKYLKNKIGTHKIKKVLLEKLNELDPKTVNFYKKVLDIKNLNNKPQSMYDKLHKPIFTRNIG